MNNIIVLTTEIDFGNELMEGYGSIFHHILNIIAFICYVNKTNNKKLYYKYQHIPNIGHKPDNLSQDEWDNKINNHMLSIIPSKFLYTKENIQLNEYTAHINDLPDFINRTTTSILINVIRHEHHNFLKCYIDYLTPELKIYEPFKKNIASFHIRRGNKNDNPNELKNDKRELYDKSKKHLTNYYNNLLKCISKYNYEIHVFSQGEINDFSDINFPVNTTYHLNTDLIESIEFMIKSDLFVLSNSALSFIINYYSSGINIGKQYNYRYNKDTILISVNNEGNMNLDELDNSITKQRIIKYWNDKPCNINHSNKDKNTKDYFLEFLIENILLNLIYLNLPIF